MLLQEQQLHLMTKSATPAFLRGNRTTNRGNLIVGASYFFLKYFAMQSELVNFVLQSTFLVAKTQQYEDLKN